MIGNNLRRADFTIPQLRVLVNVTTPRNYLVRNLLFAPIDLCLRTTLRTCGGAEKHDQQAGV
jgi:hypothetical protein